MKWCYSYIMYKSAIFRLVISLNREIPNKLGKTLWEIPDQVGNDVAETISSYRKRFLAALSSALTNGVHFAVPCLPTGRHAMMAANTILEWN